MKIGTKVTVDLKGGRRDGVLCGRGNQGYMVVKFEDGRVASVPAAQVFMRRRLYDPLLAEDLESRSAVRRVFREFFEEVHRAPTAAELVAWLPGDWSLPLARKMGLEVSV